MLTLLANNCAFIGSRVLENNSFPALDAHGLGVVRATRMFAANVYCAYRVLLSRSPTARMPYIAGLSEHALQIAHQPRHPCSTGKGAGVENGLLGEGEAA